MSFKHWVRRAFQIKKKLWNFGHMSKLGLPYLPSTLVWYFDWLQIMKNNRNPFQTTAKTSPSSSYLGFTILICYHGLPISYPTTKDFVQTFFWGKVWIQNTLPTYTLDICPNFRNIFRALSLYKKFSVLFIIYFWIVNISMGRQGSMI